MHSRFRTRGALTAALIALAIAVLLPSVANALPKPGAKPRGFRLFACMEHAGTFQREVYHPALGFYRATGQSDHEALLGILRQVWLVDSLQEQPGRVRPTADQ